MIRALIPMALMGLLACSAAPQTEHFFVNVEGNYHVKVVLEGDIDNTDAIIVLLHGGPVGGSHVYNGGTYAETLESEVAVAYVDQRAQGASQGTYSWADYGIDTAANDMNTVLDVLASRFPNKRLYLLGHSWGGMLGTATLVDTDAQSKLSGWIESAGCHDSLLEPRYVEGQIRAVAPEQIAEGTYAREWEDALVWLDDFDELAESFDESDLSSLNSLGYELESYVDLPWETYPAQDGSLPYRNGGRFEMTASLQGSGLYQLYDEATVASFSDRLGEIDIPGLYQYAKYDFVCPLQLGIDAAAANTSGLATYVEYTESGHSLMSNEPTKFTDDILAFIDDTE